MKKILAASLAIMLLLTSCATAEDVSLTDEQLSAIDCIVAHRNEWKDSYYTYMAAVPSYFGKSNKVFVFEESDIVVFVYGYTDEVETNTAIDAGGSAVIKSKSTYNAECMAVDPESNTLVKLKGIVNGGLENWIAYGKHVDVSGMSNEQLKDVLCQSLRESIFKKSK